MFPGLLGPLRCHVTSERSAWGTVDAKAQVGGAHETLGHRVAVCVQDFQCLFVRNCSLNNSLSFPHKHYSLF